MPPADRKRKRDYGSFADLDDLSDAECVEHQDPLSYSQLQDDDQPIIYLGSSEQGKVTRAQLGRGGNSAQTELDFLELSPEPESFPINQGDDIQLPSATPLAPYENSWSDNIGPDPEEDEEDSAKEKDVEGENGTSPTSTHQEWIRDYREAYLREMLWLEGRGGRTSPAVCLGCGGAVAPTYRCTTCIGAEMLCKTCIVSAHQQNPFHFIEVWIDSHFERITLKTLGLQIQLGHAPGQVCANPDPPRQNDFVVVDTTGIHEVNLSFCRCDGMKPHFVQLLRYGLFPGTGMEPRTASTFPIVRLTGNVLSKSSRDRYHEFVGMVSQWRHLKMLKRAGRGHDTGGVAGTALGSCALRCPSCPQPGINLPNGWASAGPQIRWLYRLFVSIDGNFKLRRRLISSNDKDPGYNAGWAFFVEENRFKDHLASQWSLPQDRSTCVAHEAVDKPDRQARGLAASGVIGVVCTCHEFRLPNSVGDLQHGERYINVDYIAFSAIHWFKVLELIISYDIGCQWHKKLFERLAKLPKHLWPTFLTLLIVLIPKFHLPAHVEYCNRTYSFNLTKGVGRTDGEAPERGWSRMNAIAKSTAEMGPGMRRDTLDDHMADENWGKTKKCPDIFVAKMERAIAGKTKYEKDHAEYTASLPANFISIWTQQVETWEADPAKNPNPYEVKTKGVSEQAVRLKLVQEAEAADAADAETTGDSSNLGIVQPSLFISAGVQLEEDQYKLRVAASQLGNHPTKKQLTNLAERSNILRRRIAVWTDVQKLYIPEAESIRLRQDSASTAVDGKPSLEAYEIPLLLPSSLPVPSKCRPDLVKYEAQLREGQAYDALEELRRYLRARSYHYKRKHINSRGTQASVSANTRSNTAIKRVQQGVDGAAVRYTRAYKALTVLRGDEADENGNEEQWQVDLQKLRPSDIRGLSEGIFGDSEGTRAISWIWKSRSSTATSRSEEDIEGDTQLQDALRIEFLKSRARANRWAEEVLLLEEEMRRTIAFFKHKADWWYSRQASLIGGSTPDYIEGFLAYAMSQVKVYQVLQLECERRWEEGRARAWVKPVQKGGRKKKVTEEDELDIDTLLDDD
ncbi:hypothetical protein D9611_010064 [Ephemerocybe angulata]|uniref:CxC2-like cysteine cluster KDZ transposase-associated domain-containing protein n=1 Tax=Ephemerocybe angulata TaxID=980116 RepID=A0A8H5AYX2_9AGAR|nr:hypothetical protein D9611_010064 [Tulosesus angulatus]